MPTFSTNFAPPATPTGLTIEAVIETSSVELVWTPTSLGVDFGGYRVYRSVAGAAYEEIAFLSTEANASFIDYEAPLDVTLSYQVTVSNLDFESAPAQGTTELDEKAWYIVTPAQSLYTFRLRYVQGFRELEHLQRERFGPLGRRFPIIVTGELEASAGHIELEVHPPDAFIIERIRAIARLDVPYVVLKTPFGDAYRVKIDPDERTRAGVAGIQNFGFGFDEVA